MSALYMFPPEENPTEDLDLLAGEYALGVMDAGEAAATRVRSDTDPSLLRAIGAWQDSLAPMTLMLREVEPPSSLWFRLADEIGMPEPDPVPEQPSEWIEPAAPPANPEPVVEAPLPEDEPPEAIDDIQQPFFVDLPPTQHDEPAMSEPVSEATPEPVDHAPAEFVSWLKAPPFIEQPAAEMPEPPEPAAAPDSFLTRFAPPEGTAAHISTPIDRPAAPMATPTHALPRPRLRDRIVVWQIATAAASALAVVIALTAVIVSPSPMQSLAAIGVVNAPAPIYLAEMDRGGHLRVTPLALIAVPNGRDLQLWMLPPGTDQPTSLGVLPPGGSTISLGSTPAEGTRFVVSMEPRGASTGRITGQVLYGGTLVNR